MYAHADDAERNDPIDVEEVRYAERETQEYADYAGPGVALAFPHLLCCPVRPRRCYYSRSWTQLRYLSSARTPGCSALYQRPGNRRRTEDDTEVHRECKRPRDGMRTLQGRSKGGETDH